SVAQVARACAHAVALAKPDLAHRSEQDAHDERYLAFTRFRDVSVFEGRLAGVDGKAFAEAIAACAESLRVEGDGLTRGQRNADALMLLVSKADLPKHGGLPAAVTLTMTMAQAEQVANTSPGQPHGDAGGGDSGGSDSANSGGGGGSDSANSGGCGGGGWCAGGAGLGQLGHDQVLGHAGARFGLCCCQITPVIAEPREPVDPRSLLNRFGLTQLQPVAVGRSVRLATPAQRRALAVRDGGCVIPGCDVGPEHTQPHHVTAWSLGGATDLDSLASVCWPHHRQLDLGRWELTRDTDPGQPEAGQPEAGQPEAGQPEAGQPEAGQPEVGEPSAGDPSQPWWTVTPTPRHRWRRPPP
ncbi:MAG: DUF222 domain-containing protein, partial [Candidatus Nanopelagicales bacterium]|nr:DUF222 domain-containing protein [Candidatus Nanopelagicales bacterium]